MLQFQEVMIQVMIQITLESCVEEHMLIVQTPDRLSSGRPRNRGFHLEGKKFGAISVTQISSPI